MGVLKVPDLTVSTLGGVVVLKELILTVSTLQGCVGLESLEFNSFYFGRLWWSLKELILTVSTLGRVWQS